MTTTYMWSKLLCELVLSELLYACFDERKKKKCKEREIEKTTHESSLGTSVYKTTTITNLTSLKELANEIFYHYHLSIQKNIWRALYKWRIIYSFQRDSILNKYIRFNFPRWHSVSITRRRVHTEWTRTWRCMNWSHRKKKIKSHILYFIAFEIK